MAFFLFLSWLVLNAHRLLLSPKNYKISKAKNIMNRHYHYFNIIISHADNYKYNNTPTMICTLVQLSSFKFIRCTPPHHIKVLALFSLPIVTDCESKTTIIQFQTFRKRLERETRERKKSDEDHGVAGSKMPRRGFRSGDSGQRVGCQPLRLLPTI